jgi:hypothetical protein
MKAFMLFLLYSAVMLVVSAGILMCSAIVIRKIDISLAVLVLIAAFGFCSMIASFGLHYVPEVCTNNRTTIERIAGETPGTYDVGTRQNIEQVFGESCWLWFLPIPPRFSGFAWSRNAQLITDPDTA